MSRTTLILAFALSACSGETTTASTTQPLTSLGTIGAVPVTEQPVTQPLFQCDPTSVPAAGMRVAVFVGAPSEELWIQHAAGVSGCAFDLEYRAGATRTVISQAPGGYLITYAAVDPATSARVVFAADVRSQPEPGLEADSVYRITAVPLEAMTLFPSAASWRSQTLIQLSSQGAYPSEASFATSGNVLTFTAHSSMQFLETDVPTGTTDGTYRLPFALSASQGVVPTASPTLASVTFMNYWDANWAPTGAEQQYYQQNFPYTQPGDGPCFNGCPIATPVSTPASPVGN